MKEKKVKETVEEKALDGPYTLFNLDKNQSKLFIGGYPSEFAVQETVPQNSFDGEIEEIAIGDTPVSLWNFNQGYENHRGVRRRNQLVSLSPTSGYRFGGNGFIVVDARSYYRKAQNDIQLSFKTFAPEGLLFLSGARNTFIALEIRDGKVLYKYNLGQGTKIFETEQTYNDGEWHQITAVRDGANGRLTVDDVNAQDITGPIDGKFIEHSDYYYFGGYVTTHYYNDVTNKGFDGCIMNVKSFNTAIDLDSNHKVYGVTPGCPDELASKLVSFVRSRPGYIRFSKVTVNNDFTMALKFKTNSSHGLIFYATNVDQSAGISLSLHHGQLQLISQNIELTLKDTNFNDSKWHVVSIRHTNDELRLDFDDYEHKITDSSPPPLHILHGNLYIGGLPENYIVQGKRVASKVPFAGCIGDATLNGTIINFANSTNKEGVILGSCVLDKRLTPDIGLVPTLPPVVELDASATRAPDFTADKSLIDAGPVRGDIVNQTVPSSTSTKLAVSPPQETTVLPEITTDIKTVEAEVTMPPLLPEIITDATTTATPRRTTLKDKSTPPSKALPIPTTEPPPPTCALPMHSANADTVAGPFLFGEKKNSRIEYDNARGGYRAKYEFSIDIKTNETDGLIFYAADKAHVNFVTLLLRKGHLVYIIHTNNVTAKLRSKATYNNDEWHNVIFKHEHASQKLLVDGNQEGEVTQESTSKVDVTTPFMLGGVRSDQETRIYENTKTVKSFKGCLRNFKMNNRSMETPRRFDISNCPGDIEEGNYFSGGYVALKSKYSVGTEIDIKLHIKPRNITGLLMAVHGKKDYLVLEMVNGAIKFTVENGKGPITTSFLPDRQHYLCNGAWHTIQAFKSKHVVSLTVDNKHTEPGVGDRVAKSTDTGGFLFLGSHRVIRGKVRGITAKVPFIGCIKNVEINGIPQIIEANMVKGEVIVGQCPTN